VSDLKREIWKSAASALRKNIGGLSFSDRLNVGLFILTMIAIVISLWSLKVAIVTLEEARKGGKEQQETLDESKDSLRRAANALDSSRDLLERQEQIQDGTLRSIKDEVGLLDSINAQSRARGYLSLSIRCSEPGIAPEHHPQFSGDLVGSSENKRFHGSKLKSEAAFHFIEGQDYDCKGTIRNLGDRVLDSYELSIGFDTLPDIGILTPVGGLSNEIQIQTVNEVHSAAFRPIGYKVPILASGGTILPSARDPSGANFDFSVKIPAGWKPHGYIRPGELIPDYSYGDFAIGRLQIGINLPMVDEDRIDLEVYLVRKKN
jgi:hypothetical protein